MNKQQLRSLFLEKRKSLSLTELQRRSRLLCQNAITFIQEGPYRHYHIFLPIQKQNEPDTWPIFHWLVVSPKQTAYLSKTHFNPNRLTHYQVENPDTISVSHLGIPEPQQGKLATPKMPEVVFVPLISYDLFGNRIGYGAGFYDRFLADITPNCLKVGLAITPPLDNIPCAEHFDIKLDLCITHLGTSIFN